jgi:catechol-2,3-dioxygenase
MRVHHLAFRTDDLSALERFYTHAIGLSVLRRNEKSVWLDAEGTIVMLERRAANEPRLDAASLELVAFAVPSGSGTALETKLKSEGRTIESRTPYSLYVRDPDGRRVGLSSYTQTL